MGTDSRIPRTQVPKSQSCPRQDSNLRFRLRRATLYPLSYGGSGLKQATSLALGARTSRSLPGDVLPVPSLRAIAAGPRPDGVVPAELGRVRVQPPVLAGARHLGAVAQVRRQPHAVLARARARGQPGLAGGEADLGG